MRSGEILERDDLLDQLGIMLDDAADGHGRLVLVSGEAGAGKTALVTRFVDTVAARASILAGACDPLTTPRPLSPLLDIASDAVPEIARLIADGAEHYEVFASLLDTMRSSLRPTVVVLEDVHWADDATLDLIRYVGRRVGMTHGLVVATYRADELSPDHGLRTVLGDLASHADSVARLGVESLSVDAVRSLAGESHVDVERLHEMTGGNAFYVTEVLATGGDIPTTVQDAVLARVARLDDDVRSVLDAVAIAPREMAIEHAIELTAVEGAAVDRAVESGTVLAFGASLRFRHELARAVAEDAITPVRRSELHRRMVSILERDGSQDYARLAHHAIRTGDPELTARYAPVAARQAVARGSSRQAIEFFAAAVEQAHDMDPRDEIELRSAYQMSLYAVDQQQMALDQAREILTLCEATGDPELLVHGTSVLARAVWTIGDNDSALALIGEAVAMIDALPESEITAYCLYLAAHLNMLNRQHERGAHFARRCVEVAERVGSVASQQRGTLTLGTVEVVTGDVERGVELIEGVYDQVVASGQERTQSVCLSMLGTGGGEVRIYDRALTWLQACVDLNMRRDEDYGVEYARAWMARIYCETGRWDEAVRCAELVDIESSRRAAISQVTALGAIGRVRVRRGDPGAEQALRRSLELGESGALQHIWAPLCGLAELLWFRGAHTEATSLLRDPFERAMETDSAWARGEIGFWLWWVGGIAEPPEGAALPYALHMSGDWRGAAEAWDVIGCPYERALALSQGGADAMLDALDVFDGLGAHPAASWLRGRMRDAGIDSVPRGPRRSTRENPAGLTDRQLEVLRLMSQGLGNAAIADRLYISRKTVEHHVSAILTKLGVESRGEAMSWVFHLENGPQAAG